MVPKKLTNKQKLFSESSQNLKNNRDNLLPNLDGRRFFEDEGDFETWKKKQMVKMNEELKNAVKNNEILLQQKAKSKKHLNRGDQHFCSLTQNDRKFKTAEELTCDNDGIFNYFPDLDSIIKTSKMKLESKLL